MDTWHGWHVVQILNIQLNATLALCWMFLTYCRIVVVTLPGERSGKSCLCLCSVMDVLLPLSISHWQRSQPCLLTLCSTANYEKTTIWEFYTLFSPHIICYINQWLSHAYLCRVSMPILVFSKYCAIWPSNHWVGIGICGTAALIIFEGIFSRIHVFLRFCLFLLPKLWFIDVWCGKCVTCSTNPLSRLS